MGERIRREHASRRWVSPQRARRGTGPHAAARGGRARSPSTARVLPDVKSTVAGSRSSSRERGSPASARRERPRRRRSPTRGTAPSPTRHQPPLAAALRASGGASASRSGVVTVARRRPAPAPREWRPAQLGVDRDLDRAELLQRVGQRQVLERRWEHEVDCAPRSTPRPRRPWAAALTAASKRRVVHAPPSTTSRRRVRAARRPRRGGSRPGRRRRRPGSTKRCPRLRSAGADTSRSPRAVGGHASGSRSPTGPQPPPPPMRTRTGCRGAARGPVTLLATRSLPPGRRRWRCWPAATRRRRRGRRPARACARRSASRRSPRAPRSRPRCRGRRACGPAPPVSAASAYCRTTSGNALLQRLHRCIPHAGERDVHERRAAVRAAAWRPGRRVVGARRPRADPSARVAPPDDAADVAAAPCAGRDRASRPRAHGGSHRSPACRPAVEVDRRRRCRVEDRAWARVRTPIGAGSPRSRQSRRRRREMTASRRADTVAGSGQLIGPSCCGRRVVKSMTSRRPATSTPTRTGQRSS